MRVLILNPGSSTLKASVLEPPGTRPRASATVELGVDASRGSLPDAAVERAIQTVRETGAMDGVGYRVVHGGTRYTTPVVIDDAVVDAIDDLAELAPLHNRVAAATIRAGRRALPAVPHVAAFDTAFHASLPAEGYRYPVPEAWFRDWGMRRFGFHGLSVEWSVRRAAELLERPAAALRLVVAHLGSGCSVTAVDAGRCVATSMGMTPLEGLMMGTRAGSIDPGMLVHGLRQRWLTVDGLADVLDHGSGLAGVSGRTSDVRELLRAEADGDGPAALALALFVRRAAGGIADAATALRGLDAIVFTGGIGEHAAPIRSRIVERLSVLGAPGLPAASTEPGDRVLAAGPPAVLRVAAREDVVIADAVVALAG